MTSRQTQVDILGFGHAIVDILVERDETFLQRHGLAKGSMTLVDEHRAERLFEEIAAGSLRRSGGSAANTIAGVASLGGRGGFVGKVGGDDLGHHFRRDIESLGVVFAEHAPDSVPTGKCVVLVTSDAQRTMATFLGAGAKLAPSDVPAPLVAGAKVVYLEGYLWDPPSGREACRQAAKLAHEAGNKVALTLSDPFCVERHRQAFREFLKHGVDILFANEVEIMSLFETDDFDAAVAAARDLGKLCALTRSSQGSVVVSGHEIHTVAAKPARVVDTTGAGDLYAAGFLYGLTQGRDLKACGEIGSLCAAEIIGHFGARPEVELAGLLAR